MSKQKTFSLGQTLVGSTSFTLGVVGQKQERLDLPETEENDNLVAQTRQLGGETGNKNTESGNCSHVLAPALVNTGKLAKDVVDEASRSETTNPLRPPIFNQPVTPSQVEGDQEGGVQESQVQH